MDVSRVPRSFVAIGDSFTEGLDDPDGSGGYRGWADLVAERFAARGAGFRYANLAVRGRKLGEIVDEQLPTALDLAPDLVSLAGGTNDMLRPSVDLDALGARLDTAVSALRAAGSDVVLFQNIDPGSRSLLIGRVLPRLRTLSRLVEEVADRRGAYVVRLWGEPVFAHPRVWSGDRLHLSTEGHLRVAGAALETLGLGDHAWADPMNSEPAPPTHARLRADAVWVRRHLGPWVVRRLRGASSGDTVVAKRPVLAPWSDRVVEETRRSD